MRLAVMALSALGTAYAALEAPALRWNDDPLGNDAILAFVSDATYGVRGTWESATADGRSVCIGPPIATGTVALNEACIPRVSREIQPVWPGVAEALTRDGLATCVSPDDAPVSAVIDVAHGPAALPNDELPARSGLEPLSDRRYGALRVEQEIFSTRRLMRLSAMAPTCRRTIC